MDVGAFHLAFVRAVAQGNALHERIGGGLQINEQVGSLDLFGERFMYLVIHLEFIALEVDAGEERVFGKGVISEQIFSGADHFMDGAALLVIAAQQKEDLGLKSIALTVAIKIREERILLEDFQNDLGIECRLKQAGKGRLTDSDDPFDGNVHEQAPKVMFAKDTIKGQDEKK